MTEKTPVHVLSEFTDCVNQKARRAAMDAYLASDVHTQFLLADNFAMQCRKTAHALRRGIVAPQLAVCCCRGTFEAIFVNTPYVNYEGCALPEMDDEDAAGEPLDQVLTPAEHARLSRLSGKRLVHELLHGFCCSGTTYSMQHFADAKAQTAYYGEFLALAEASARYAKRIGSEAALLWLEAIRLLQPKVDTEGGMRVAEGLDLDSSQVKQAYSVAEKAQAKLWVDNEFRRLAPLEKSTAKKR